MKKEKTVNVFGNDYLCTQFWSIEGNCSSIDVSLDGMHLGSILGLEIPDSEDSVEYFEQDENFTSEVIDWIVDNEK